MQFSRPRLLEVSGLEVGPSSEVAIEANSALVHLGVLGLGSGSYGQQKLTALFEHRWMSLCQQMLIR